MYDLMVRRSQICIVSSGVKKLTTPQLSGCRPYFTHPRIFSSSISIRVFTLQKPDPRAHKHFLKRKSKFTRASNMVSRNRDERMKNALYMCPVLLTGVSL